MKEKYFLIPLNVLVESQMLHVIGEEEVGDGEEEEEEEEEEEGDGSKQSLV